MTNVLVTDIKIIFHFLNYYVTSRDDKFVKLENLSFPNSVSLYYNTTRKSRRTLKGKLCFQENIHTSSIAASAAHLKSVICNCQLQNRSRISKNVHQYGVIICSLSHFHKNNVKCFELWRGKVQLLPSSEDVGEHFVKFASYIE